MEAAAIDVYTMTASVLYETPIKYFSDVKFPQL